MGNFASTARVCSAVSADRRLDAMEKQQQQESLWAISTAWIATAVTSVKAAVLGTEVEPAASETAAYEDCDLLAMARPDLWELCASATKDDDCESCTTDATDALTESESESDLEEEEEEQQQEEADDSFFDALDDVASGLVAASCSENTGSDNVKTEKSASDCHCHCDALVERLHRLAASPSPKTRSLLFLDDYMCPCGDCPNAKRIALDVAASSIWSTEQHKRSLTRVLQAFATYNEVIGYDREMLAAASECLRMWEGAEDHAFTSFAMLFE